MKLVLVLTTEVVATVVAEVVATVVAEVVATVVAEVVDPGAERREGIRLPDTRSHNEFRNL